MRDGYDRLVEYALWAWSGQRRYGLSGVGNVRRGVWVVLKLEWQPLHPRAPPVKSCRVRSSPPLASSSPFPPSWPLWQYGAFCFLFDLITILASAVAQGLSVSRSAPSPPSSSFWPQRQLLSWIWNGCFVYFGHLISSECIV